MVRKYKSSIFKNKYFLTATVLIVLVGLGVLFYQLFQSHKRLSNPTIPTQPYQTPASNNNSSSDKQPVTGAGSGSSTNSGQTTDNNSSSGPLAPYGSFVSNHKPSGNDIEQSVCNTTAGATCYIQFTKDSITKKLDAKATDINGSVIWNWSIKDAGLSAGSWQITAVSSLNGVTASTQDSIKLEVNP